MKLAESLKNAFKGMGYSVNRFPQTVLFLLAVAVLNALMIENRDMDFTRLIYTFLVGAMLSVVGQMLYERFFVNTTVRYGLMVGGIVLTIGYYFAVGPQYDVDIVISIKTFVALFALLIAFIWIPSINSEHVPFHRSFLSAVKSFFVALLFSVVLGSGIGAIYSATDYLLFDVDSDVLSHLLNIVVSLFAPIYFLSLTPLYPGEKARSTSSQQKEQEKEKIEHQFTLPRFFEILLSNVVIPLIAIYTLILIVYILMNITGEFWTNNLLEPLLVSYAIIVITMLILSYNIENRFVVLFRQFFPKILVPIAVFQTIASILKISEMGITHGRYYVILFGVFSTIVGLIFSLMKPKYHGYIAAVLLLFVALSIIPPVDAFTISRNNQLEFFEDKLRENNLLVGDDIRPNEDVSVQDRIIITNVATYINEMGYNDELTFLPDNFNVYNDFNATFGFNLTYSQTDGEQAGGEFIYLNREEEIIELSDADTLIFQTLSYMTNQEIEPLEDLSFVVDNENYQLERNLENQYYTLTMRNEAGEALLTYNLEEVFENIFGDVSDLEYYEERFLGVDEATFTTESEEIELRLLVLSLQRTEEYNSIEVMLFINIK